MTRQAGSQCQIFLLHIRKKGIKNINCGSKLLKELSLISSDKLSSDHRPNYSV